MGIALLNGVCGHLVYVCIEVSLSAIFIKNQLRRYAWLPLQCALPVTLSMDVEQCQCRSAKCADNVSNLYRSFKMSFILLPNASALALHSSGFPHQDLAARGSLVRRRSIWRLERLEHRLQHRLESAQLLLWALRCCCVQLVVPVTHIQVRTSQLSAYV